MPPPARLYEKLESCKDVKEPDDLMLDNDRRL